MTQEEKSFELWELVGDRWTLPIQVRWEEGFALVTHAPIPLLEVQKRVMSETLDPYRNAHGEFVISDEELRKHARKSKLTNPEDVVDWRRAAPRGMNFKGHPLVDEFLDAFVAKGGVPSRPVMAALYSLLVNHMLDWLLNRQKPLDLIFCVLYPVQYRRNWKEIVLGKAYHRGVERLTRCDDYRADLESDLIDFSLIGKTKDDQCAVWTLECVTTRSWKSFSEELERRRMSKLSGGYWLYIQEQLKARIPYALEIYRSYLNALRAKAVTIPTCRRHINKRYFFSVRAIKGDAAWVVPHVLPSEEESGQPATVASPDAALSPMPGVQPPSDDVRDTREDVPN